MPRTWLMAALLAAGLGASCATAADPGVLRWGGDAGGGAPYVYKDDGGKLVGFEVDLAQELAKRIGRRAEFVQQDWETLPQALNRGDIDVILNGYEWTAEREQAMASTIPYYVAGIQLIVTKGRAEGADAITGWDDLRRRNADGSKKSVAVLSNSASWRYVQKEYGGDVTLAVLGDEGTTGALDQVAKGRYDATVQDELTASYYLAADEFKDKLQTVGPKMTPKDEGYFVIYTRKSDTALRDGLNDALRAMMEDGTLKSIYQKDGVWNEAQATLPGAAAQWPPSAQAAVSPWLRQASFLLRSAGVTVLLSFLAFPIAVGVGLLVALGRLYGARWLAAPLSAYVELLRGTPVLLQLYVIYFLLPSAHIYLPAFWAGVIGLAINYSAYEAENYRAGILAIPKGQLEAALALGMTRRTALWRVVIPQAVRVVIPPVTNDFIALFKDTSVCSVVAVTELTGGYRQLVVANPGEIVHLAAMTAILYLLMSYPLSLVARRLEKRFPKVVV
ncbi:MAG TPA: ABC transporter substrate-binding protein/permease [Gemmataceae bacterium]|nr:ABC transporter substrate-binding protein/permease [Gemmataceae bacterium]